MSITSGFKSNADNTQSKSLKPVQIWLSSIMNANRKVNKNK